MVGWEDSKCFDETEGERFDPPSRVVVVVRLALSMNAQLSWICTSVSTVTPSRYIVRGSAAQLPDYYNSNGHGALMGGRGGRGKMSRSMFD